MNDARLGDLVRACAFALTTAEFGIAGQIAPDVALEAVADELDLALRRLGVDIREFARVHARVGPMRDDH